MKIDTGKTIDQPNPEATFDVTKFKTWFEKSKEDQFKFELRKPNMDESVRQVSQATSADVLGKRKPSPTSALEGGYSSLQAEMLGHRCLPQDFIIAKVHEALANGIPNLNL